MDDPDKWRAFYEDRAKPCPFFVQHPDENLAEWIRQRRIAPGRALDVGCGNARNAIFLARNGFDVTGVDFSPSAIDWASDAIGAANVAVSVHCTSIFDFPAAAAQYDVVYDSGCFHHLAAHRRDAYAEVVRTFLRPGGMFGLVCFAPAGDPVQGFDEDRLRAFWSRHFEVASLRRMREQGQGSNLFGKDFLWALLARRR